MTCCVPGKMLIDAVSVTTSVTDQQIVLNVRKYDARKKVKLVLSIVLNTRHITKRFNIIF
jgi:hypothetical protein